MPSRKRYLELMCGLAAILVIAASHRHVHAQSTGRITGKVTDAITGDPVADVMVAVLGATISVGTDEEGVYSIDSVVPGLIRLRAQLLGYLPITTDYYSVLPDTSVEVDFKLAPIVYELDPVEVTAREPGRRWQRQQGAQLFTPEQLPERGNILDALQGVVPGVRVRGRREDTRLVVRGAQADVLYVLDGNVLRPPLTFYVDAQDVDCVEVRKGFSAVMEFKPPGTEAIYAGVVLIFTRDYIGSRPRGCRQRTP